MLAALLSIIILVVCMAAFIFGIRYSVKKMMSGGCSGCLGCSDASQCDIVNQFENAKAFSNSEQSSPARIRRAIDYAIEPKPPYGRLRGVRCVLKTLKRF